MKHGTASLNPFEKRNLLWLVVGTCALAGLVAALPAAAGTINVNTTAQSPGGAGDCTLGEAITAANNNAVVDGCTGATAGSDTILLPAGTYTLTVADNNGGFNGVPHGLPIINSAIIIQGATSNPADTIIEGPGAPSFLMTTVSNAGTPLTLENLTVRNFGPAAGMGFEGGAIQFYGPLTITNCVIANNVAPSQAVSRGGALTSTGFGGGPLTITDSVFSNNSVGGSNDGGAILLNNGALTITNSTFTSNSSGNAGGAIRYSSGTGTIAQSSFVGNTAGRGGAVSIAGAGAVLTINKSFFMGNTGDASGNSGGAIDNGVTLTVADSLFLSNAQISGNGSGGAIGGAGSVTITGSTFVGNSAFSGGALNNAGSAASVATIANTTFSGNMSTGSGGGGAINHCVTGVLNLNNVTLTLNTAPNGDGGGLRFCSNHQGITIQNSILAGNTAGFAGPDCLNGGGTFTSQGHNIIGINDGCGLPAATGDLIGTAANPIDPVLGDLQDNGGAIAGSNLGGQTPVPIDTHALLIGSPALEAGDPGTPGSGGTTCEAGSQNGVARPGGTICDIGAFEDLTGAGVIPVVDLSVLMTDAPDPVAVNTNITYQVTVNNGGNPDPATDVLLTNMLPMGVTFVSATPNNMPFGSCLEAGGVVTCDLGTMGVAGSVVVDIVGTVTPAAGAMIVNTANVTTTGADTDPTNDSAAATTAVTGANVAPVANGDMFTTNEDQVLNVAAPGVLVNDTDADNDPLTAVLDTSTVSGMLTLNADGSFTYTPNANFNGMDSFTYHAHDGQADSNIAAVTLTINAANDPPSFTAGPNQTVLEDSGAQTVAGWATNLSPGPADESGQTLAFLVTNDNNALFAAQPAVSSIGTLTYTPAADANGSATVTVTLMDNGGTANGGNDTSAPQMFTVTVNAVNDAPGFTPGPNQGPVLAGSAAQTVTNWATGINAGPANESSQTLSFTAMNDNNAIFSAQPAVSSTGTLTYTPAANASGVATVTVTLMDNGGTANGGVDTSAAQMFTITVNNFGLTANPTMGTIPAGQSFMTTLTATAMTAAVSQATTFSCGNLPFGTACTFSPASLNSVPLAPGASVMLTITTTAASMARLEAPSEGRRPAPIYALWLMLPGVAGVGLVLTTGRSNRRRHGFLALLAVALVMSTLLAGCGGGSEMDLAPGTPTGTHNITVTATAGNVQRTANVTIVVQ